MPNENKCHDPYCERMTTDHFCKQHQHEEWWCTKRKRNRSTKVKKCVKVKLIGKT